MGGFDIESRKLIPFGKFSYVVSLPKKWIKKNNLAKGTSIFMKEDSTGIMITPSSKEPVKAQKEIVISADDKSLPSLKIKILSAYINNYNLITVKSDKFFDCDKIKEIFHSLIAMEVVEQTKNKIVAKDFLNYDDASIDNILKRIDNITRTMIADSFQCIDEDCSESVVHRDLDVNRLFYLSQRVIKTALNDPILAKSFKLSNSDLMDCGIVIMYLEKIADASKRIARLLQNANLSKSEKDNFRSAYKSVQQNFLDVMKAFHTNNIGPAFDILNENRKELSKIKSLGNKSKSAEYVEIIEKLRSVQSYVKRISQVVVNKEMGEKNGI